MKTGLRKKTIGERYREILKKKDKCGVPLQSQKYVLIIDVIKRINNNLYY